MTGGRWPHANTATRQEGLGLADRVLAVVKDRCRERCVCAPLDEPREQVFQAADAPRCDDWYAHALGDAARELEVISFPGSIAVHARQQDLARADARHVLG